MKAFQLMIEIIFHIVVPCVLLMVLVWDWVLIRGLKRQIDDLQDRLSTRRRHVLDDLRWIESQIRAMRDSAAKSP